MTKTTNPFACLSEAPESATKTTTKTTTAYEASWAAGAALADAARAAELGPLREAITQFAAAAEASEAGKAALKQARAVRDGLAAAQRQAAAREGRPLPRLRASRAASPAPSASSTTTSTLTTATTDLSTASTVAAAAAPARTWASRVQRMTLKPTPVPASERPSRVPRPSAQPAGAASGAAGAGAAGAAGAAAGQHLDTLRAGAELRGVVRAVMPFGAFLDVGVGRDGLLPAAEMDRPGCAALQRGSKLTVWVRHVNAAKGRISLSLAAPPPRPTPARAPRDSSGSQASSGAPPVLRRGDSGASSREPADATAAADAAAAATADHRPLAQLRAGELTRALPRAAPSCASARSHAPSRAGSSGTGWSRSSRRTAAGRAAALAALEAFLARDPTAAWLDGVVAGCTDFGAFVRLGDGSGALESVDGLLHRSALQAAFRAGVIGAAGSADGIATGQSVRVRVTDVTAKGVELSLLAPRIALAPLARTAAPRVASGRQAVPTREAFPALPSSKADDKVNDSASTTTEASTRTEPASSKEVAHGAGATEEALSLAARVEWLAPAEPVAAPAPTVLLAARTVRHWQPKLHSWSARTVSLADLPWKNAWVGRQITVAA